MERRISTPEEVNVRYRKVGVVIFVFNRDGEVLLLRENSSKLETGKQAGQYGVICETSEIGEDWKDTAIRGFKEELGINPDRSQDVLKIDPMLSFLGEAEFIQGVLARVLVVYWNQDKEVITQLSGDGEVEIIGWEKVENLPSYALRQGVRNILGACVDSGSLEDRRFPASERLLPLSIESLSIAAV